MERQDVHLDSINATIAHPIRRYKDELSKPKREIAEELSDGTGETGLCRSVQDRFDSGNYQEALEHVRKAIEKLEKLESEVDEDTSFYRHIYEKVDNSAYYAKIVETAGEHGHKPCVLGALKSVEAELETAVELHS